MAFVLAEPNTKHGGFFWARGIYRVSSWLMGCSGLCPLDRISLNISTERAQGPRAFPKPLVEEWNPLHVLGPVPGVDVMAKRSRGG
jgi:hypothetical protein